MTENWPTRYPGKHAEILAERSLLTKAVANELLPPDSFEPVGKNNQLSLLDPHETTSPKQLKPTYRQQFLEPVQDEYDATCEAYAQIYPNVSDQPRYALDHCRDYAYFAMDRVTGDIKVMSSLCRQRWCPMCANMKASFARESTQSWIESLEAPRFLTLTLKHCEDSLKSQIEFLQDAFRRLRYRSYWKKRVFGGIWFLQVHRSSSDGCWHPHFHILLDGKYLKQGILSDLWGLVTFGSPVLDIRRIHNPVSASHYVARYSARPAKFAEMPMSDRVEMIQAMKGKRLSGTFGTAKCVTLTPPKTGQSADWVKIGYYDNMVSESNKDPNASLIVQCWIHGCPITEEEFEAYTGHPVNIPFMPEREPKQIQYLLDFFDTS